MKRTGVWTVLCGVIFALFSASGSLVSADQVTDTYGSGWAYCRNADSGVRAGPDYVPKRSDYRGASFKGHVITPDNGAWGGASFFGSYTFYIFRTVVRSRTDSIIPLRLGGDDGHSVYVEDEFRGGGGFGVNVDFDLALIAGVPVELEIALYNSEGPWVAVLLRRDTEKPIVPAPGLRIRPPSSYRVCPP